MRTFFRIHVLAPLKGQYIATVHATPYINQQEANTIMMDHLDLILHMNNIMPATLDPDGTISSCVQECVLADNGRIEVLHVPTREDRPTRELLPGWNPISDEASSVQHRRYQLRT